QLRHDSRDTQTIDRDVAGIARRFGEHGLRLIGDDRRHGAAGVDAAVRPRLATAERRDHAHRWQPLRHVAAGFLARSDRIPHGHHLEAAPAGWGWCGAYNANVLQGYAPPTVAGLLYGARR